LVIDEAEAPIVRLIFERYCALASLIALMRELREREVVTRLRTLSSGRTIGGIAFTKGPLAYLLKNRVYLGEINHGQSRYPGEHPAIVDKAVFDKRRRSSPATQRPRAIPNPDRRRCSSEGSTTTVAIE
jgi:site-specific DNA recombinase